MSVDLSSAPSAAHTQRTGWEDCYGCIGREEACDCVKSTRSVYITRLALEVMDYSVTGGLSFGTFMYWQKAADSDSLDCFAEDCEKSSDQNSFYVGSFGVILTAVTAVALFGSVTLSWFRWRNGCHAHRPYYQHIE